MEQETKDTTTTDSSNYRMHTNIGFSENANFQTLKPIFVLESLSFKPLNSSKDLNYNTVKSSGFSNDQEDSNILIRTKTRNLKKHLSSLATVKNMLPCDNISFQNLYLAESENVPSDRPSHPVLTPRPRFILESLSFKGINKMNACDESNSLIHTGSCNTQNSDLNHFIETTPHNKYKNTSKDTITVSTQNAFNMHYRSSKYSQTSGPKRGPFFVLESLSYNESGILRIVSKNTSEGKSYEVLHANHTTISKQANETTDIMVRKVKSPANIYKAETKNRPSEKYQNTRKGRYLNFSDKINSTCRSRLSRVVQYKHALLSNRENEAINRCLLLEMDPMQFEILKTVRQPYVVLEKLPD